MNISEIANSIKSHMFLEETILQLEKDFLMIGVHFDIEKPISTFNEVLTFTFHLIEDLFQQDFNKILNFLYRIDLSEDSVKLEMQNTSLTFTEMLSNMIVKRELKKVILKNYYTGY